MAQSRLHLTSGDPRDAAARAHVNAAEVAYRSDSMVSKGSGTDAFSGGLTRPP